MKKSTLKKILELLEDDEIIFAAQTNDKTGVEWISTSRGYYIVNADGTIQFEQYYNVPR